MVVRHHQPQLLLVQAARDQVRVVRHRRGQAEIQVTGAQPLDHRLAVVLHELEPHPGVVGTEGADQARYGLRAHGVQEAEGDLARRGVGVGPYGLGGTLDVQQRALGGGQERAAGRGEGERPAAPGEERDAEVGLQPDDGAAEGGLRHTQLVRGARDVLVARDGGELREPGRQGQRPRIHPEVGGLRWFTRPRPDVFRVASMRQRPR